MNENGGTVQMGPVDAEGVGRMALCLDPFKADFVLLTPTQGRRGADASAGAGRTAAKRAGV